MTTPRRFDPMEFYNLGLSLAASPGDECALRTATGRIYYALFLIARDRTYPGRQNITHVDVANAVKRRAGRAIGDKYKAIQRLRKVADYELTPVSQTDSNWNTNWAQVWSTAANILPHIRRL
jgi:hypothetical protein